MAELGCADEIVAESIKATRGVLWDGSSLVTVADFSVLKGRTRYPFISLVPQFITEQVLTRKAVVRGIRMFSPLKVVGLKINKLNAQYTDVIFEDGQVVEARYVVGADGAKSTASQVNRCLL
jgi:2-polyprenyl-6-methoxyphenol hydroxylase-like FAD-dependent oxidoreductase